MRHNYHLVMQLLNFNKRHILGHVYECTVFDLSMYFKLCGKHV